MYTKFLCSKIKTVLNLGCWLGYFPLKWSNTVEGFEATESKCLIIIYAASALSLLAKSILCIFGAVARILSGNISIDVDISLHVVYANAFISMCGFNFNAAWKAKELAACFNNLLRLDSLVPPGTMSTPRRRASKKVDRSMLENIAQGFIPWALCNVALTMAFYFVDPTNGRYPTGLWSGGHFWTIAVYALFEAHYLGFAYFLVGFNWFGFMILFCYSLQTFLTRIQQESQEQNWKWCRGMYCTLEVWVALYNDCIALMWPTFIYMNVSNHVIFLYITVSFFSALNSIGKVFFLSWAILWVLLELFVYFIPGRVQQVSTECVRSIKLNAAKSGNLEKQWRQCMKPIQIRVGNVIPIQKYAPLLILSIVINVTINLILFERN